MNLSGKIRYNFTQNHLDVTKVRIQGKKSDFMLNGRVRFADNDPDMVNPDFLNMDLRADIKSLSLGEFGRTFPIQMPDTDIVSGNLSVLGPVSKMDCQIDLTMDNIHVTSQGLVTIDESNTVGLDIAGKINGLDLSALPVLDLAAYPGNLNTDFSLVWQQIGMPEQAGQINLELTSSVLWDYVIDRAKLNARISGDDFVFETLRLETPYGKLSGNLDLAGILSSEKDNQIRIAADIESLNPGALTKNAQYSGSINGTVHTVIHIPKTFVKEEITAEATCRIDSSRMVNTDILSGELKAALQDENITVNHFDLRTTLGTVSLKGAASMKEETCRMNAHAVLPDLKLIRTFFPDETKDAALSGSVTVSADIDGRWDAPYVTAVINAEKVAVMDVSADALSVDGNWKGSAEDYKASVNCVMKNIQYSGFKIPRMDLKTTLSPSSVQADIEIEGGHKESLLLSGSISHWLEPEKEVLIEKMTLKSFDQPSVVNREPVNLYVSPGRIRVGSMHLDSGKGSLFLKGEAGFHPPADVSADFSLHDFDLKRISGFWEGGEKIQGLFSSDVTVAGFLEQPVIHMTASIQDASYDKLLPVDLAAALHYENSKILITGSGERQGRKIIDVNGSASASLALVPFVFTPEPESLLVALHVNQIEVTEFSRFFPATNQFQGYLSSDISLTGEPGNPDIDMNVSMTDVVVGKFSVTKAAASIKYSDSTAQVTASAFRRNEKLLDVHGSSKMVLSIYPFEFEPSPGGLDFSIEMDQVDISWISDIINDPEYHISGILDAAASVSGDFSNPEVRGRMQLSKGSLNLKKQKLTYETMDAKLRFVKNAFTIDALFIKGDKEGSLNLSGDLTHDHLKPRTFNIKAVGDQLYIPFHSGVYARINPDITLFGEWDAPVLQGVINVTEGQVNLEQFLEKKFSEIKIVPPVTVENGVLTVPEREPEPLEFVDPLTADVTVKIPDDFWIKGKDEFVEIKGNIQLKKDPFRSFILYGSVQPVRGTYRFRGKLFQIKQGELRFTGQEDINPSINIEAVNSIGDVKIIIRLTGTFEQLNVVLDSDPAMDQSAIISYLVFGRAPDDLSEKESFQAQDAALSFTGQIAADQLRDIVGDALGIDYLNINAGSGGIHQGSLTMGKYVLPKVFVTFRQGFDQTTTQQLSVTYTINKHFDLETQVDDEQTSAVDLIWKYEY
jgi:translocation and assembly module TamB